MPTTMRVPSRFALLLMALGTSVANGSGTIVEVSYPASDKPGELALRRRHTRSGSPTASRGCAASSSTSTAAVRGLQGRRDGRLRPALAGPGEEVGLRPARPLLPPGGQAELPALVRPPQRLATRPSSRRSTTSPRESEHPELAEVPWCLWGHSGGGFWASLMQTSDPERIVAVWLRSGTAFAVWEKGEIPKPEIPEAAYRIPMMCNPGARRRTTSASDGAWTGALAMFQAYRAKGAPIGFAPDPRTGHECGDSRYLAIPFFDACLAQRLPERRADGRSSSRWTRDRAGWRRRARRRGGAGGGYHGRSGGGRLAARRAGGARPGRSTSRPGPSSDTTPPPAPTGVKAVAKAGRGVEITWDAEADFESGLRQFVILRDGREIGQVPEKPVGQVRPAAVPGDVVPRHAGAAAAGDAVRRHGQPSRARRTNTG